jgi:protease IV
MRESIFYSALRSFFIALFGIAGLVLGLILVLALFGGLSSSMDGTPTLTYTYTPEIKPNADGVRKIESSTSPVILKVNISGVIGLDSLTRKAVAEQLVESREQTLDNDRVKAILLQIDSPGGTVVDSDGIYREIKAYKEKYKVPVYAYIDGFCASGGYYIASAADKVFASDTSLIGSVGVLLPSIMNFSGLLDKIGVKSLTLYDGKGKDNLNPFRPWREGEEDNIKNSIDYYYEMFVDVVTKDRPNLDKTKLVKDYGANIYPATIAKEHGYIDEANFTQSETLKLLAEKAGIKEGTYQVIELSDKNWITELFRSEFNLFSGKITHHFELTPGISSELSNQYLYLYRP